MSDTPNPLTLTATPLTPENELALGSWIATADDILSKASRTVEQLHGLVSLLAEIETELAAARPTNNVSAPLAVATIIRRKTSAEDSLIALDGGSTVEMDGARVPLRDALHKVRNDAAHWFAQVVGVDLQNQLIAEFVGRVGGFYHCNGTAKSAARSSWAYQQLSDWLHVRADPSVLSQFTALSALRAAMGRVQRAETVWSLPN